MRGLPEWLPTIAFKRVLVPAHAGVTRNMSPRRGSTSSRPRTCGGYPSPVALAKSRALSSPHMRGLPAAYPLLFTDGILVPAHAGVTRRFDVMMSEPCSRPRTCGGYPVLEESYRALRGSSPHMRGLPGGRQSCDAWGHLVPAHAGVTRWRSRR